MCYILFVDLSTCNHVNRYLVLIFETSEDITEILMLCSLLSNYSSMYCYIENHECICNSCILQLD